MELIFGLISGAVGGNPAGKAIGGLDQGTLINSIGVLLVVVLVAQFLAQLVRLIWLVLLAALVV